VVRVMREHVRAGTTVYDIGAHIGYLTLTLGRLVGPRGTVVAVEADPRNGAMLRANLDANGATNVAIVSQAISDEVGVISFATFPTYSSVSHISEGAHADDAVLVEVPATTIDELAFGSRYGPPAFIKIDVEGAELRVLGGAERTLREVRPTVICEARRGVTLSQLAALATRAEYDFDVIDASTGLAGVGVVDVLLTPQR
jgi:FkbM family methyltransferase